MTYFYKFANTFVPFLIAFMLSLSVGLASPNMAKIQKLLIELKSPSNRAHSEVEKEIWSEWSRSGDQNLDMLLIRGRFFMQSGRLEDAIVVFSQIISIEPLFAEAWNARATTFYMKGDFKNSISDIDKVLLLNAQHFGALSGLGAMLENLGHLSAALDAFQKAEKINPLNSNIKLSVKRLKSKIAGISL